MSLNLSIYDTPICKNCLTARDVTRHADLYATAYLSADNRAAVAHLLEFTDGLMAASQVLMGLFLTDGHDSSSDTQEGLTDAQRAQVLALAATCAYNATLFVQEAQHRRIKRAAAGWDPITTPITV
jgi:hypothetical protein